MNRLTKYAGFLYLGLSMLSQSAQSQTHQSQVSDDPVHQSPLQARGPASLGSGAGGLSPYLTSPGMPLLQAADTAEPKSAAPWRLLGSCRRDTGMSRSQDGVGYGDCRN